jgi:hypothetical protein
MKKVWLLVGLDHIDQKVVLLGLEITGSEEEAKCQAAKEAAKYIPDGDPFTAIEVAIDTDGFKKLLTWFIENGIKEEECHDLLRDLRERLVEKII